MCKDISFIIPVYNGESTIEYCLDSILQVKTNLSYEIIVVNDGSTDQTTNTLSKYHGNTKVKIFTQANQGVAAARNLGIQQAKGKWVCFVDADDSLTTNWATEIGTSLQKTADLIIFTKNQNPQLCSQQELAEQICIPHGESVLKTCWSKLYLKDVITKKQIFFDPAIINGEDMIFNLTFIAHSKTIISIPKSFYIYRHSSTSATNQFSNKYIESDKRFQRSLAKILKKYYPNKLYLSQLSKLNAWYTIFMRYGRTNAFHYDELRPFTEEVDYREALQNYKKFKGYFYSKERILLLLLHYGAYKTAFKLIHFKKQLSSTQISSEEI